MLRFNPDEKWDENEIPGYVRAAHDVPHFVEQTHVDYGIAQTGLFADPATTPGNSYPVWENNHQHAELINHEPIREIWYDPATGIPHGTPVLPVRGIDQMPVRVIQQGTEQQPIKVAPDGSANPVIQTLAVTKTNSPKNDDDPDFMEHLKEHWYWYAGGAAVLFLVFGGGKK